MRVEFEVPARLSSQMTEDVLRRFSSPGQPCCACGLELGTRRAVIMAQLPAGDIRLAAAHPDCCPGGVYTVPSDAPSSKEVDPWSNVDYVPLVRTACPGAVVLFEYPAWPVEHIQVLVAVKRALGFSAATANLDEDAPQLQTELWFSLGDTSGQIQGSQRTIPSPLGDLNFGGADARFDDLTFAPWRDTALDEGQVLTVVSGYPLGLASDPPNHVLLERLADASAAETLLSARLEVRDHRS
jgi:hypothetical protein